MPTIDWDKWARGAQLGFPKNRMWSKIRSGEHDENGEPKYLYDDKPNTDSMDPKLADVIAEHRFVQPAVRSDEEDRNDEHCFCGWVGEHHADHLTDKVNAFVGPDKEVISSDDEPEEDEEEEKKAPKPAPRRAKKDDDDKDDEK